MVWAFAKVKHFNRSFLKQAASAVAANILTSDTYYLPQALSNIVWAFATLNFRDDNLSAAIAVAVNGCLARITSRDIAQV